MINLTRNDNKNQNDLRLWALNCRNLLIKLKILYQWMKKNSFQLDKYGNSLG